MIRLAVCDPRTKVRQTLRKALGETVAEAGIGTFTVGQFASIDAAVETLGARRQGYCSLLLCGIAFDCLSNAKKRLGSAAFFI